MDIAAIIEEITRQRDALDKALIALNGAASPRKRRGRPPNTDIPRRPYTRRVPAAEPAGVTQAKPKRKAPQLTPEGRKRLSDNMKKRWALKKKAAAKQAGKKQ